MEASARLALLGKDASWANAFAAGNPAARAEFKTLTALIASGKPADFALAGVRPLNHVDTGEVSLSDLTEGVAALRERGVGDEAIAHLLHDKPVSAEEVALAKAWRAQHFGDPDWTKRYLAGDVAARREATLSAMIIATEVRR